MPFAPRPLPCPMPLRPMPFAVARHAPKPAPAPRAMIALRHSGPFISVLYMNKRYTRKRLSYLPVTLLQFLFVLKLFHWNTDSYAKHVSSDQLYTSLSTHIDEFVEILIRNDKRPTSFKIPAFSFSIQSFTQTLHDFRRVMERIQQTDLINLRDEIINDIDQFSYRLTLH